MMSQESEFGRQSPNRKKLVCKQFMSVKAAKNFNLNQLSPTILSGMSTGERRCAVSAKHYDDDCSSGIVHRFEASNFSYPTSRPMGLVGTAIYENTFAYYSANGDPNPSPSSQPAAATPEPTFKCPCCRETTAQMLCATCATTALRLNKLRQQYKTLFHCKADVCLHIDQQLKREADFQVDIHRVQGAIKALRSKVDAKRARLERLRQRVQNADVNCGISSKNIALLEKKIHSHTDRIVRTNVEINHLRELFVSVQEKFLTCVTVLATELFEIFPIKHFERSLSEFGVEHDAWRNHQLQNIYKRKLSYYTIKSLQLNDYSDYEQLVSELQSAFSPVNAQTYGGSPAVVTPTSSAVTTSLGGLSVAGRQSLAALLFISQIVERLTVLLSHHLPYRRPHRDWLLTTVGQRSVTIATGGFFATDVFKLNYVITALCLLCGVDAPRLDAERPAHNLCQLFQHLNDLVAFARREPSNDDAAVWDARWKALCPKSDGSETKLRTNIVELFHKLKWEERRHDFTLDNVEEDWVNVAFAGK